MPEGPEVRTTCEMLRHQLRAHLLQQIIVYQHKSRWSFIYDLEGYVDKFPMKCLDVLTVGKQLFFFFEHVVINGGMGMTGKWLWDQPQQHTKLHFVFEHGQLYFDESRPFSEIQVITYQQLPERFKKLGIDLLNVTTPWDSDLVPKPELPLEKFKSFFGSKAALCKWMLRQDIMAGIGNYLRSEICYIARLNPLRKLNDFSTEEIERLYHVMLDTIRKSYLAGGCSFRDYVNVKGEDGKFVCQVYGRKICAQGYPVSVIKGGQSTYWVPELQH